jgi:hypothetical protein
MDKPKYKCWRCADSGEVVQVWHGDHWTERPANLDTLGTVHRAWLGREPCSDCKGDAKQATRQT